MDRFRLGMSQGAADANTNPLTASDFTEARKPWGLHWRSSIWFSTTVIGCGIGTDLLIYSLVVPVVPFQLESLGYTGVSNLVGWLLFAFSGGLVVSTLPLASLSEKYSSRKMPLILGLVLLIGSQVMFMEAPTYWLMCLARVLQGISSSVVWVVGLALLCDAVPEAHVGKQLGLAMTGMTVGLLLGAPVGGALYGAFGFRAPFIFGIIITFLDLIGRLLIIERKDALKYGWDPTAEMIRQEEKRLEQKEQRTEEKRVAKERKAAKEDDKRDIEKTVGHTSKDAIIDGASAERTADAAPTLPPSVGAPGIAPEQFVAEQHEHRNDLEHGHLSRPPSSQSTVTDQQPRISMLRAVISLGKSPRAMTAYMNTLILGIALTAIEPALPLHMQSVWGYKSTQVGLVSIAAVVPTIFASPLAGWYSDRAGPELVILTCMLMTIPWWILFIIPKSVVLFIVSYAFISFFIAATIAPVMQDLAIVSHGTEGVGFAHVYGAFNLAYGVGNAIGPIIGGQVYDHVPHGWSVVCFICAGVFGLAAIVSFFFSGGDPMVKKVARRLGRRGDDAKLQQGRNVEAVAEP